MPNNFQKLADRLAEAHSGTPVAPLRDGLAPLDIVGAYAVQTINTKRWLNAGRRIVGRKIGLTSTAVQTQLGVAARGEGLCAGDVVLTGALGPMVAINPGEEIVAKIGGLGVVGFKYE